MEIKKSFSKTIFGVFFAVIFAVISFFAFIPLNKAKTLQVDFNSDLRTDVQTENFYGSSVILPKTAYWRVLYGGWADDYADDGETAYLTNLANFSVQFTYENMGYGLKHYFSFSSCYIPLSCNTDDASDWNNLETHFVRNSALSDVTAQNTTGIVMQTDTSDIKTSYATNNTNTLVPFQYIELPDNLNSTTHPYLFGRRFDGTVVKKEISWSQRLYLQVFDSTGRCAYIPIFIDFISGPLNVTYSFTNNFIGCTIGKHMNIGTSPNVNYVGIQYLTESTDYVMPKIYFETNFDEISYNNYFFPKRTYYFSADKSGYTNGYNDGIAFGLEQGFSQGEQQGYTNGYANGHTAGVSEANTYSFTGLISAVIDAPIKAITGLFDFTIFGVNFKNFALAILTFSIILVCVRLLMKGGK